MRNRFSVLAAFLFLTPACLLRAQDRFYVDGEIRERGLYSHGYMAPMAPDETGVFWVGQRARLGFGYEHENLGLYIQAEDARVWGQSGKKADGTGFTVSQAWFFMNFGKGFGMKLGRQTVKYEDGRYIHNPNWLETTTAFDALRFTYQSPDEKARVEVLGSFSNHSTNHILNPFSVDNYYKYLAVVYASYAPVDDLRVSLLSSTHLNERFLYKDSANGTSVTDPKTLYTTTALGVYFDICKGRKLSALVYGYGQWGRNNTGVWRNSYLASAKIKYQPLQQFRVEAAYDYATRHFNRFMGSGNAFFGIMDYFVSHSGLTHGLSDLHQPYLVLTALPHPSHTLALSGRYFFATDKVALNADGGDGAGAFSRDYGFELALTYKYQIHRDVTLSAGYAWHSRSDLLAKMYGLYGEEGRVNQYAYLMISYKPVLFDSNNKRRE